MLNDDWKNWVRDSYNRGCCPDVTRQILKENNFGETAIDRIMEVLWTSENRISELEYNKNNSYICMDNPSDQVHFLSKSPVVATFDNLLSNEECEEIISLGKELQRAKVVSVDGSVESDWRTSSLMSLEYAQTETIDKLEKLLSELCNIPIECGERLQLMKYEPGQFYKPHNDWFTHDNSSTNLKDRGQRIATAVIYLNDVPKGGETAFPKLNISVLPKIGSAVYFEYTDLNLNTTDLCLHSGEPVIEGEKWILTKWFRSKPIHGRNS